MTTSGFMTSFNKIEAVLKEFGLLKMSGVKSITKNGVSKEFKNVSIKEDYFNCYKVGLENNDFDFLLEDDSYFQFEYNNRGNSLEIRYAFFQNPIDFISYEDFLDEMIEVHSLKESKQEIGALFESEYNQFLSEKEAKNKYLTIRYDVDYANYQPLIHSVSHLHIGHQNNLRIPIEKFISPLAFVAFVLKNVYYNKWKEKIITNPHSVILLLKNSLKGESLLRNSDWSNLERLELYLK